MTVATESPSLVASINERGIVIRGLQTQTVAELVGSLPARWNSNGRAWICEPTAASARRLRDAGVDCSDELKRLAASFSFRESLQHLESHDLPQPRLRLLDAWAHQRLAYHFSIENDAAELALDMGCGKSKVTCDLAWNRRFQRILILCPASVLGVWRREFAKHSENEFNVVILDQSNVKAKAAAAGAAVQRQKITRTGEPLVIVVNYESAWREPLAALLAATNWDAITCDESHKIKSATGKASKFIGDKLRKRSGFRLNLTGTPMPHSPGDLFGQFRFLDPGVFGSSWTRFRQRFAVCANPHIPQQITGWRNQEELAELASLLMLRVTREDAKLGLPDIVHQDVPVVLSPKAMKVYGQLEKESIAELEDGMLTADNALVRFLRLQQITSGYAPTDDGGAVVLDTSKRDALADLLDGLSQREPVVVFCRFRHDIDAIAEVSASLKRRFGEVSGRRKDLTLTAEYPEDVDVLAVQIASGGVGIDLTRACYAVFYSLGHSLGDFEQAVARLHRPGQTRPVMVWHLVAENTVDRAVYAALQKKRDVIEEVFSFLRNRKAAT